MKKLTRNEMKGIIGGVAAGKKATCVDCGSVGIMCGSATHCIEAHFGSSDGLACTNSSGDVQTFTACPRV